MPMSNSMCARPALGAPAGGSTAGSRPLELRSLLMSAPAHALLLAALLLAAAAVHGAAKASTQSPTPPRRQLLQQARGAAPGRDYDLS